MITAELRGGNKPSLNEALGWIGSKVDDIYGASVGRLEDVWIDPGTGAPKWLLVKEGRFGGRTTLIPFEDATAGAGHVWIPYERDVVRDAPAVSPGAPLTQSVETALRSHYASNKPTAPTHRGRGHAPEHQPPAAAPAAAAAEAGYTQPVHQYQLAQGPQAHHDPHQPLPPVPPSPAPAPPPRQAQAPQPQPPSRPQYAPQPPAPLPRAPQPRPAPRAPQPPPNRRAAYPPPVPQPPAYPPATPGYSGYAPQPQPPAPQQGYTPAYAPPRVQAPPPSHAPQPPPAPRQAAPPPPPALAPVPPAAGRPAQGPLGTDDPDRPVAIPIIHGLDQPYRIEVHLEGDLRISGELKGFSIEPAGGPPARAPEPGE